MTFLNYVKEVPQMKLAQAAAVVLPVVKIGKMG